MLKNGKRLVAAILALFLCLSMPLTTFANEVSPETLVETNLTYDTGATEPPVEASPEVKEKVETTSPAEEQTTPSPDASVSPAPSASPEASVSPAPSASPEASVSPAPSASPEASVSPAPSVSPETSITPNMEVMAVQPADVTLTLGQSRQFYLDGEYTQRCYVTFPQSGYFTLDVQVGSAEATAKATVRFVSGSMTTTYLSGSMGVSNKVHLGDWFDAGTYCVLISLTPDNGNIYWPMTYTVSTSLETTSAATGNGDLGNARDLAVSSSYVTGLLSRTNNASWWKITLASAGRLEIGLKSYVSNVEAYVLQLRNGQRTRHYIDMSVAGGTDVSPQYSTNGDWLEAGVYYLCINGMDSNTGIYGVMATFTPANNSEGDNNNYLTATGLTLNGGAWRCLLSQTDEVDIFSFTLPARTEVTISAKAYMSAMNLQLFNANMRTLLADASASGTDGTLNKPHSHIIEQTLDAGTYLVMAARDPEGPRGIYTIGVNSNLTISALTLNASVFNKGDAVVVSCGVSGKTPVQYSYQLQKQNASGNYDNIGGRIASTRNVFSVIPGTTVDPLDKTGAGVYRFEVRVSDNYTWANAFSEPFTYKDVSTLTVTGVWSDRASLSTKETITFTAGVTGGSALKQTTFCIYDAASDKQIDQIVSSSNIGVYQPKKSGTYKVMVVATDGMQWAAAWGTQTFTVAPLAVTTVTLSPDTAVTVNRPLTIAASYVNTVPNQWVYEVYYRPYGGTVFNFLERFSSSSDTFKYSPRSVGSYQFMAVATDGKDWASCWSKAINVGDNVPLQISAVTPSKQSVGLNESVNFSLSYSGGATVQLTEYQLYNVNTGAMVDKWKGNSNSHSFAIATAGTYHVMAVAYDGITWTAAFSDQITVGATTPITITSLTANKTSIRLGDVVTFNYTIGTGKPVQYDYYIYNENDVLIQSIPSRSPSLNYTFNMSGKYKIMGVVTDGYNWASAWCSTGLITVESRLSITSVALDSTSKTYPQSVIATPTFSGGKTIQQIYYEVYDASTNQRVSSWSGKSGHFTFVPATPSIASYRIMVVATDGTEWVSMYSPVVTYTKPAQLQITKITNNGVQGTPTNHIELGQSLTFRTEITGGAALRSTEFQVYRKVGGTEMLVDRMNGNSTSFTFTPDTRGEYRVMFVAYDGIDWVAKYSEYVEVIQ